jgi:pantothenate synthetase
MSSRNERLNVLERAASIVYQTLLQAKVKFSNAQEVTNGLRLFFSANTVFELEYFQIADAITLTPCKSKIETQNTALL